METKTYYKVTEATPSIALLCYMYDLIDVYKFTAYAKKNELIKGINTA